MTIHIFHDFPAWVETNGLVAAKAMIQVTKALQMAATLSSIRGDTDFGRSGTLSFRPGSSSKNKHSFGTTYKKW